MNTKPWASCLAAACALAATAGHAAIDTAGLKLVEASGVPDEPERKYVFQGAIRFSSNPIHSGDFTALTENFWAEGVGRWDQKRKEADETFKLTGSVQGLLKVTFKCPKDPWLTKTGGCVLVSAPYKGDKGKLYDWPAILGELGRPLSGQSVDAALAHKLSMQHPDKPPGKQATVPPPKKPHDLQTARQPAQSSLANADAVQLAKQPPQASTLPPIAGARAVQQTVAQQAVAQAPDLTSAPQLEVAGKHSVAWNGALALTDADARARSNGVCRVAFAHVMRNAGSGASGAFSRRWSSPGQADMVEATPSIPAGGSLQRTDTLPLRPGVNTLSLGLDPTNAVKESNKANNTFTLTVTLNGTCGSPLANAQASKADNLRFAPAQANARLPAVQVNPGPPNSPIGKQQQR